jgi:hypothetical protein
LLGYPGVPGLSSGDPARLSLRYWGLDTTGMPRADATAQSLEAAKQSWQQTRPGDAVEALRWADAVAGPSGTIDIDNNAGELWYEVAALRFQARSLAVLEQVATYYRARALDGQGQPTGDLFVGTSCAQCDDLLARPAAGVAELAVGWKLMRTATVEDAPRVVAAPRHHLPAGDSDFGLPNEWTDLRFAWGGKYTRDLRCVVPGDGGSTLRLFVGLQVVNVPREETQAFRVQVRGRLAGWSQVAGPLGSALAAAQARD